MSLLLLESCEKGYYRWLTEGSLDINCLEGLYGKCAFVIHDNEKPFTNKIMNDFKSIGENSGERKFRLSFWMKTNRKITKNSEFITLYSQRDEMGGSIGINTKGQFYVGYLTENGEWQGVYAHPSRSQIPVTDGKMHHVEMDIRWDTRDSSQISIWVDGKKYLSKNGANVHSTQKVWSRPDSITFGNLIGTDLFIDDIIVWDDLENDYKAYQGPKRITITHPLSFTDTEVEEGEKVFETFIPPQAKSGIMTMIVKQEPGTMSSITPILKTTEKTIEGKPENIYNNGDNVLRLTIGKLDNNRIWMGLKRND